MTKPIDLVEYMGSEIGQNRREIGDFMGNTTKGRLAVAAIGMGAILLLVMSMMNYQQQMPNPLSSKDVSQPQKE